MLDNVVEHSVVQYGVEVDRVAHGEVQYGVNLTGAG